MSLTDEEFRDAYKPLEVPAHYQDARTDRDKVVFALADMGEGTAEAVSRHFEELEPKGDHKLMISTVQQVLTDLYKKGLIAGCESDGNLVYNLHKITQANSGATDPSLLAPGLD